MTIAPKTRMSYTLTTDSEKFTGTTTVYGAVVYGETLAALAQHHGVSPDNAELQLTPKREGQR